MHKKQIVESTANPGGRPFWSRDVLGGEISGWGDLCPVDKCGGGDEVPKFGLTNTSSISWLDVMIDVLPGDSGYGWILVRSGAQRKFSQGIYQNSNHYCQSQLSKLLFDCETMKTSFLGPPSGCTKPRWKHGITGSEDMYRQPQCTSREEILDILLQHCRPCQFWRNGGQHSCMWNKYRNSDNSRTWSRAYNSSTR